MARNVEIKARLRDTGAVAATAARLAGGEAQLLDDDGTKAKVEEIKRAVDQGYMVFKMHSDARFDIIEQTRVAQEVAPPGFKLHWDLNHNRSLGNDGNDPHLLPAFRAQKRVNLPHKADQPCPIRAAGIGIILGRFG